MECVRRFPELFEAVGIAEEDEKIFRKYGGLPVYAGLPRMTVERLLAAPALDAVMVECDDRDLWAAELKAFVPAGDEAGVSAAFHSQRTLR